VNDLYWLWKHIGHTVWTRFDFINAVCGREAGDQYGRSKDYMLCTDYVSNSMWQFLFQVQLEAQAYWHWRFATLVIKGTPHSLTSICHQYVIGWVGWLQSHCRLGPWTSLRLLCPAAATWRPSSRQEDNRGACSQTPHSTAFTLRLRLLLLFATHPESLQQTLTLHRRTWLWGLIRSEKLTSGHRIRLFKFAPRICLFPTVLESM
jgi:hypothetical protein